MKGEPLDYSRTYSLSTKHFISRGKDGYTTFLGCKLIKDEHAGIILQDTLKHMFETALDAEKPEAEH